MAATKILNIQKNDSFGEIFDAFKKAEAEEIIFIIPKGSVLARNTNHLQTIKEEAEKSEKTVNILTTDVAVAGIASSFGFGILQNPAPKKRQIPAQPPAQVAQEETVIANLTMAKRQPKIQEPDYSKKIRDIVSSEKNREIEVEEKEEDDVELNISRTPLIPPKQARQKNDTNASDIERLWEEEEKRQDYQRQNEPPKKRMLSKRFIFIPIIGAMVVLGIVLYTIVGNAKITIYPKTEEISFSLKVTADTETESVQNESKTLPGQLFSILKEASGSYPSSVEKEVTQKASGVIKIYNTSEVSQRLVATTRFESPDGLIFRIQETITVPASSSVEASAYADRAGSEYNIAPTRFTVPGLAGTPKFNQFYAVSSSPMTGGIIGRVKVASESDFLTASEELSRKARTELEQAVREQIGDLVMPDQYKITIGEPVVNAKVGEATDTLEMKVRASTDIIAFRASDMETLIQDYLGNTKNLELIKEGLNLEYHPLSGGSAAGGVSKKIQFNIKITGRGAARIDTEEIMRKIPNMKIDALKSYLENEVEGFGSAKMLLSPFWVTKVPDKQDKIKIIIDTSK